MKKNPWYIENFSLKTNQSNNAGLSQNIYSHWVTILLRSVKFNSGFRSKVWVRVSFTVHIVQLTTWKQDISLHSAAGSKASVVLVWPQTWQFAQTTHTVYRFESYGTVPGLFWKMTLSNLQAISLRKTPSPWTGCGGFLHKTQRWSALTSVVLSAALQSRDWGCQINQPDPFTTTPLIWIPLLS